MYKNSMTIKFSAISQNESFARSVIACFALQLNPSLAQVSDIKTAVSEAVTNAIVHAYPDEKGQIEMQADIEENELHINIVDNGVGIENLSKALEPFYTTKPDDERSGMGFTIMKSFMDEVRVESQKGVGTKVFMTKILKTNL